MNIHEGKKGLNLSELEIFVITHMCKNALINPKAK